LRVEREEAKKIGINQKRWRRKVSRVKLELEKNMWRARDTWDLSEFHSRPVKFIVFIVNFADSVD
jgi:hypothetical protein